MVDALPRLRAKLASDADSPLWTRPFLLVCGIHLFTYSSYAAVNPTFAAYLGTVTSSESLIGVAFGVFTFAAVLARPLSGWLLDRIDRRVVLGIAAVALAGTTLAFTWATVIWVAILLRVFHGVAWGVNSTATPTLAADVVPEARRSEGFAYFGVVPNLALMVLPPVGLWVAHQYGFGLQFAGAAVLALLAVGPLLPLDDTAPATNGEGELYAREALPAALLVALAGAPVGAIDALIPLYAPTVGLGNAGVFFTVMGGAIIVARSALGRLPGTTVEMLAASFALQAGGLALLGLGPQLAIVAGLPLGVLGSAALFGFGFALVFPLLQNVAVSATGGEKNGSANATVLTGLDVGIGIGALISGIVAEAVGFASVYTAATLVPICGLFLVGILQPSAE